MTEFLRVFLPIYFVVYFGIAFVAKSIQVARRIGKSPLVLPADDTAYGLIGRYFKVTIICMLIYVFCYALLPKIYPYFLPIPTLENSSIQYIGLGLLIFSLIWTIIAQNNMKDSWRIGIDSDTKNELVTSGLFHYSRNPIFFGMIISLLGLFFCTPNAVTAIFLIVGYMLIQIQIRLEEDFLTKQYGQQYLDYKQKVRRLI